MIRVIPEGRLANNLFQYVFSRVLHDATGLRLDYSVNTSIFSTPKLDGSVGSGEPLVVSDYFDINKDHVLDVPKTIEMCRGKNVVVHGYFQNKSYFNHRREMIKKWLGEIPQSNKSATGIHVRKTDYKAIKWDLPDSFYEECIKSANPSRLLVFTDEPEDVYVKTLISRGGELVQGTPEQSIFLLGTCGKQIISRSTFSWWSSFLSSPEKVYYPRPLEGWWSVKDSPHKIIEVDSSEYHYVET
jgi:hypothetical protein